MGGVLRHTGFGPSENRVISIKAVERRTAGAPVPLVAAATNLVAEIGAASALHDVAADRRHIAQLAGCGEQQCLGNDRESPTHLCVGRHVAHPCQCSNAPPPLWGG